MRHLGREAWVENSALRLKIFPSKKQSLERGTMLGNKERGEARLHVVSVEWG